jgi:uncharacterized protein
MRPDIMPMPRQCYHRLETMAVIDLERLIRRAGRMPSVAGRALVKLYRYTFSAFVGFECRHLPTCSEYADEALARHGLWAGSWMTLARLSRCHPRGTSGLDFVPGKPPEGSCWYLPWRYGRWRGVNASAPATESGQS